MRKFFHFIFLFLFFAHVNSYSQDLIVTNVGDSLNCKIVVETKDYIQFNYNKYNYNTLRELRTDKIKSVIPNYYLKTDSTNIEFADSTGTDTVIPDSQISDNVINPDTSINIVVDDMIEPGFSKWQFGINGGYAYRLFKPKIKTTPYELKYLDELKSGYSLGAEVFYFPWEKVGFGMKYDVYKSKGQRDIRTKDDITIQFIGASVAHRLTSQTGKSSILTAFWLGYQPYQNVARYIGQDYKLNAKTMGWGISVGWTYKVTQKMALSFSGSCFLGSIYHINKEWKGRTNRIRLPKDKFEDLSRAELSVGLKFLK